MIPHQSTTNSALRWRTLILWASQTSLESRERPSSPQTEIVSEIMREYYLNTPFFTELNVSFPCKKDANGTTPFQFIFTITTPPFEGSITFAGIKTCICSLSSCFTVPPSSDNNVFYIIIGCLGGLILIVIVAVVLYHCIMCKNIVKPKEEDEEE